MKAREIGEAFREIVDADAEFEGVNLRTGQDEAAPAYPCVVFDVSARAVGGSAGYIHFELTMWVHSEANESQAEAHAELVEKVRKKFFGAVQADWPAVRLAIKTAVDLQGKFRLLGRGHDAPAEAQNVTTEETRWKTPVVIAGTVEVL